MALMALMAWMTASLDLAPDRFEGGGACLNDIAGHQPTQCPVAPTASRPRSCRRRGRPPR